MFNLNGLALIFDMDEFEYNRSIYFVTFITRPFKMVDIVVSGIVNLMVMYSAIVHSWPSNFNPNV